MVQEATSLKGRTVAVTRPTGQAEEAGEMIAKRGGKPYLIPTIEIKGPRDLSATKKFIEALARDEVDYVIFMSINGVRYLLSAAESLELDKQLKEYLKKTATVAVGPKTAQELIKNQIHVGLTPARYTSEGIIESLQQRHVSGKSIWIPRTSQASPALAEKLREMGNNVQEVYVYESRLPVDAALTAQFLRDLVGGQIHAIIFSSSLGVKNLFRMLEEQVSTEKLREIMHNRLTVVAIGPATAETLAEMGLKVDVMPEKHLFEEALNALGRYWATNSRGAKET
jgi:uroporphyrinogen-III synthase